MLKLDNTMFVLVDVQEKLWRAMYEKEELLDSVVKMVQGAKLLGIPILWTEQNPKGLGQTMPEIRKLLAGFEPVTKLSFSCCGEERFVSRLKDLSHREALVAGIESHVCVYQTVDDLVKMGYQVQVIADAVSSRTLENKALGLEKCRTAGAALTSVETALFELLRKAEGDKFKQMLKIVK